MCSFEDLDKDEKEKLGKDKGVKPKNLCVDCWEVK